MKVRFAAIARVELRAILIEIRQESPLGATRMAQRVVEIERALANPPRPGRRTDDPLIKVVPLVSYPYLLFYEVHDAEIVVTGIRHGARDPATMPGAPDPGDM